MDILSKFNTGIFIYNYLRNIYVLPYREHLTNENILWGFSSVDSQTCIVNTSQFYNSDIQLRAVIDSVQHRQTTSIKLITAVYHPQAEIWKDLSFELKACKYVLRNNASNFQSKDLKGRGELSGFFTSKDNDSHIIPEENINNLILLVSNSIMAIELIYHVDSKHPTGYFIIFPRKGFVILELILSSSRHPNQNTMLQMVETVVKNKKLNRDRILIITSLKWKKEPIEKFITMGEIQHYKKEKIKKTPLPVPTCVNSAVLKTKSEFLQSVDITDFLGLPKHNDLPKNWDSLAALSQIVNNTAISNSSAILDAGGEYYSVILHQLASYGYTNLHCVNLAFKSSHQINNISYQQGDITKTTFNDNVFSAITCLSVVEHIVGVEEFFKEMRRILKHGGILFISTDYWKDEIDTHDKKSYSSPLKIFDNHGIMYLINVAKEFNLELIKPINLSCKNKVVSCDGFQYTFLYLTFRKT
jgi:hypothetical protein